MSEMTAYQLAVAEYMETAPEELREYVCERLRESNDWKDELGKGHAWVLGECPIYSCGFTWGLSPEKSPFWGCIARKEWKDAMATEFWQSRQANEQEAEMTEYQKSVQAHMATAPEELRLYVCGRLNKSSNWKEGLNPISFCGFSWAVESGLEFWNYISSKKWQEAMDTEFWKNRQANERKAESSCNPYEFIWQSAEQIHKYKTITSHDTSPKAKAYDFINPPHYQKFSVEVIDMMVAIWGKEATAIHCEMCAFKYRLRMGEKPEQPVERDLEKVNWYLNKAKELRC